MNEFSIASGVAFTGSNGSGPGFMRKSKSMGVIE